MEILELVIKEDVEKDMEELILHNSAHKLLVWIYIHNFKERQIFASLVLLCKINISLTKEQQLRFPPSSFSKF